MGFGGGGGGGKTVRCILQLWPRALTDSTTLVHCWANKSPVLQLTHEHGVSFLSLCGEEQHQVVVLSREKSFKLVVSFPGKGNQVMS